MGFLLFSYFQVKDNLMLGLPEALFQIKMNVSESWEMCWAGPLCGTIP